MRLSKLVAILLLPLFLLVACAGQGITSKEEMLRLANTPQPNTALFFWDYSFNAGYERLSFYQDGESKGSFGPGQALSVPLQPGRNVFNVAWETAAEIPATREMVFEGKRSGPSYFVVDEAFRVIVEWRSFVPVSKDTFIRTIRAAKLPSAS